MFNTNFGTTPSFGAFNSATSSSSNVFGQQQQQPQQTTSLFGSGGFNQPKTSFGPSFGATTGGSTMFQQNRLPGNNAGIFSGNSAAISPFNSNNPQVAGTSVPFAPITGSDTMMRNGTAAPISTRHQCITCMKEYESKSLEELRLEDYQMNRKGPAAGSTLFQTNQPAATNNLFGQLPNSTGGTASTFPQPQTSFGASGGLFSNMSQPKPTFFGATPTSVPSFGTTTSTGFPFSGAVSQAGGMFGQTTNTTAGLGTTSSFGFGQQAQNPVVSAAPTFGGFGATANTTLNKPLFPTGGTTGFAQQPATNFGAPATGGIFSSAQPNKPFGFGTSFGTTVTSQPAFGSTASPSFTFSNPTTTPSLNFGMSSAPSFGSGTATNTMSGFGTTPSYFASGTAAPGGASNFSFNAPQMNSFSLFNQPSQQTATAAAPPLPFATTPFKDSPLFYNLITDRNVEEMKKPTSMVAQRSFREASRRKTSSSNLTSSPSVKSLTFPVNKNSTFQKGTIFEGFDEDEYGTSEDLLTPRCSVKKLNLKSISMSSFSLMHAPLSSSTPRNSFAVLPNPTTRNFQFDNSQVDESLLNGHWGVTNEVREISPKGKYLEMNGLPVQKLGKTSGVILQRKDKGYYIRPDVPDLDIMTEEDGNCYVRGLIIGRANFGEIRFLDIVNVKGLNIDEIVCFRHKEVIVYPNDDVKPKVGEGLNVPAEVYLFRVWPIDKVTNDAIRDPNQVRALNYGDKLKKACGRCESHYLDYDEEEGIWSFRVDHFSKYSCEVEEAEDEEGVPELIKALPNKGLIAQVVMKVPAPLGANNEGQLGQQEKEVGSGDRDIIPSFVPTRHPGEEFFDEDIENVEMNPLAQSDTESERDEVTGSLLDTHTNLHSFTSKPRLYQSERLSMMKSVLAMELDEIEEDDLQPMVTTRPQMLRKTFSAIPASSYLPRVKQPPGRKVRYSEPTDLYRCDSKRIRENDMVSQSLTISRMAGLDRDRDQERTVTSFQLAMNLKNVTCRRREKTTWKPRRDDETLFARVKTHRECLDSRSRGGGRISFGPLGSYLTIFQINNGGKRKHIVRVNTRYDGRPTNEKLSDEKKATWDKFQVKVIENQLDFFIQRCASLSLDPPYFIIDDPEHPFEQMDFLSTFIKTQKEMKALKEPEEERLQAEHEMWRLISILWPPRSTLICEDDESRGVRKRRLLSQWLKENGKTIFGKNFDGTDLSVFGLVAKGQQREAAKLAKKERNNYLSSCLGLVGCEGYGRLFLEKQIQIWGKFDVWKHIDYKTMIIFKLCAGIPVWDGKLLREMSSSDWLYYFALYLWYISPTELSVERSVLCFQAELQADDIDAPFPANPLCDLSNLCVNLLKMVSHYGYPMHRIVSPRCSSLDALDYKVPWMVMKYLTSNCGLTIELHLEEDVALGFATMLEDLGLIGWGKFVLSCLPISKTRDLILWKLQERIYFEDFRLEKHNPRDGH